MRGSKRLRKWKEKQTYPFWVTDAMEKRRTRQKEFGNISDKEYNRLPWYVFNRVLPTRCSMFARVFNNLQEKCSSFGFFQQGFSETHSSTDWFRVGEKVSQGLSLTDAISEVEA